MSKQIETFKGMEYVRDHYTQSGQSDTDFSKSASEHLGFQVSMAKVRSYRYTLGIPNNSAKTVPVSRRVFIVRDSETGTIDCVCSNQAFADLRCEANPDLDWREHEIL